MKNHNIKLIKPVLSNLTFFQRINNSPGTPDSESRAEISEENHIRAEPRRFSLKKKATIMKMELKSVPAHEEATEKLRKIEGFLSKEEELKMESSQNFDYPSPKLATIYKETLDIKNLEQEFEQNLEFDDIEINELIIGEKYFERGLKTYYTEGRISALPGFLQITNFRVFK